MNGFISYAHDDHRLFKTFRTHLRAVERAFGLTFWSDERINAGYHWNQEILKRIEAAEVFVLLTSPAFLASDYIYEKELPAIQARRAVCDQVLVLPVVLDTCYWQLVGALWQAAPVENGSVRAIADWKPQRQGHDRARAAISDSIKTFYGRDPIPLAAP